jgi:hypothetical protein
LDTTTDPRAPSADVSGPGDHRERRFSAELDRRGLFLRLGRTEAYLCAEPEGAWVFEREAGGLDAQAWRLRLVVERMPAAR